MDGYKRRKTHQFAKSTADRYHFKTIYRLYNKKLLHNTKFLPAFFLFLWDFSRANNIKKQPNMAMSVIKLVIEFFPVSKTDIFDCEIP